MKINPTYFWHVLFANVVLAFIVESWRKLCMRKKDGENELKNDNDWFICMQDGISKFFCQHLTTFCHFIAYFFIFVYYFVHSLVLVIQVLPNLHLCFLHSLHLLIYWIQSILFRLLFITVINSISTTYLTPNLTCLVIFLLLFIIFLIFASILGLVALWNEFIFQIVPKWIYLSR